LGLGAKSMEQWAWGMEQRAYSMGLGVKGREHGT